MKLLDHTVAIFLIFWGNAILFSLVSAPIYIPTSSAQGSVSSTASPTFMIFCLSGNSQGYFTVASICIYLMAGGIEHISMYLFPCTCWPFVCLWESVISGSLCALVTRSLSPTLCNPMDCSPPSSSAHGILQARILKRTAIPFNRGSCRPRDQALFSCIAGRFFTIRAAGGSFRCFARV